MRPVEVADTIGSTAVIEASAPPQPRHDRPTGTPALLFNYADILTRCEPFLIAHRGILDQLDRSPMGVHIPPGNIIDPQLRRHEGMLGMMRLVDRLTYGPYGMQMPDWVFYDCAVMPGAVFGLGMRVEQLEPWALAAMKVPAGYDGLVPVTQFIAIPMLEGFGGHDGPVSNTWLMYSMGGINQVSRGMAPPGVFKLTLVLGLRVFPISILYGTTQWRSPKLAVYVDLGPLELLTAYTPAHSLPRTLSFRLPIEEAQLNSVLASPRVSPHAPPPNAVLDLDSVDELMALQGDIEAGWRALLVGHPTNYGAHARIALHRSPPQRLP